jgi:GNAT superfamily N-acetyltransferase
VSNRYWGRIYSDYPEFQFALVDGGDVVAAFERGGEPDRVCALAIVVAPAARGRGVSRTMLEHMRKLAAPIGPLVAPVRPTLKGSTRTCRSRTT